MCKRLTVSKKVETAEYSRRERGRMAEKLAGVTSYRQFIDI